MFVVDSSIVSPIVFKLPFTVKLSPIITSEVVWPIVTGLPLVAVFILTPFVVLVLSKVSDVLELTSNVVPVALNVPSMSVLSKLAIPSTAKLPEISAFPLMSK